jgi:pimeloyl-ACP methyl ester carboxylesterase
VGNSEQHLTRDYDADSLGIRTRVLETGPHDAREAVVLFHGSPGSANHWDALLPEIGIFARAVAFDLPGFGKAEAPASFDGSANSYGLFVAGVLQVLGIDRAHVVMSDIGGSAGLHWAAAHPHNVGSVVLINAGVLIDYRWHFLAQLHRPPVVGALVAATARLGLRPALGLYNRHPKNLPTGQIKVWQSDYTWPRRRAMLRFYRARLEGNRIAAALRPHDHPALVVWGAHDRFTRVEQAERQRESFPSADIVVLPESGHYPHLEDPPAVAAAVIPFLRQRTRTASPLEHHAASGDRLGS